MLRTISTPTYDPEGFVELDVMADQTDGVVRRRVSRTATLDGSAAFNDLGFSDADRTIELRWRPASANQEAVIRRLVRTYSRLLVATPSGIFSAAPELYSPAADESRLTLLVAEKLSE